MAERKTFTITEDDSNKQVELAICSPQFEDFEESDRVYAAKVATLVRDSVHKKLLTRRELETFLKEQGIWTDKDRLVVKEYQDDITTLLTKLRKGGIKLSEVRQICLEIADKRRDMVKVLNKRQIFDDTTIEALAESDRNDYLIYISTVYSDGKNYWQSFEDMKNDKLSNAYRRASVVVYETIYGVNPEFEKSLPENKLLLKYGFIDKDLNYTDRKTGGFVDREGKPIEQLQKEAAVQYDNLQGEVVEETPFVDDYSETENKTEPVVEKPKKKKLVKQPELSEPQTV